ncbi:unnamed protein product [Chondrus crispus]|uniref:Aminoacyl-transfer RNA synthetases class-II family profile domain-containing protein n=1 Tax=Chondrus crispus TaxID=2769 RepID=R7QH58_CHOCR|nr:unnamed protein product [Chondrus crispus]CDF36760.1 unnamed protein product [Chondrus crispus]|eukprot:XP_005716579.1 unnamed protein product [Chondrus crispus]
MAPKIIAKPPKGTRDIGPEAMAIRERAFTLITSVFRSHGAVSIDTPVFELRDVLQNKYGEDSKLIYDLSDDMSSETGEKLSLRYDLSVPFARYIASNNVSQIKRYHIGKVYRRDRPAMERGRFREFFQCDFDIAGTYPAMVPDAEVLVVMMQMFDALAAQSEFHAKTIGSYRIKVSNRAILDAIFRVCGVPDEKLRTICSAVDKLDKETWDNVRKEMVVEKGLAEEAADRIGEFVKMSGEPLQVLGELRKHDALAESCGKTLDEMEKLFHLVECMREGMPQRLSFDLSLARGLDYYTGVIFEAVLVDRKINLGSIGAGGRYDKLVSMFKSRSVPCVGCSLGIERIMNLMVKARGAGRRGERGGGQAGAAVSVVPPVQKGAAEAYGVTSCKFVNVWLPLRRRRHPTNSPPLARPPFLLPSIHAPPLRMEANDNSSLPSKPLHPSPPPSSLRPPPSFPAPRTTVQPWRSAHAPPPSRPPRPSSRTRRSSACRRARSASARATCAARASSLPSPRPSPASRTT